MQQQNKGEKVLLNTATTDRKFKTEKAAKNNAAKMNSEAAFIRQNVDPTWTATFQAKKIDGAWQVVSTQD